MLVHSLKYNNETTHCLSRFLFLHFWKLLLIKKKIFLLSSSARSLCSAWIGGGGISDEDDDESWKWLDDVDDGGKSREKQQARARADRTNE